MNNKHVRHTLGLSAILLAIPSAAHAYVDPGFLSSAYQFVYLILFGVVAGAIFKPWNYLKAKFFSKKADNKPSEESNK